MYLFTEKPVVDPNQQLSDALLHYLQWNGQGLSDIDSAPYHVKLIRFARLFGKNFIVIARSDTNIANVPITKHAHGINRAYSSENTENLLNVKSLN